MNFDPSIILNNAGAIWSAFMMTVYTWLVGSALGLVAGFVLAALMLFGGTPLRLVLRGVIELVRGTPFLVILFLVYYGGPAFGIRLGAITAGVLCIAGYSSVYFAEIFRSGFASVPRGQLEAGECLGLSRLQLLWRVQLPQMLVLITPAIVNMLTILCKETAVLSIITVPELTAVLTGIGTRTFTFIETLLVLCIAYLLLVELTSRLGRVLERRVGAYLQR
ncbi:MULTISPECIES: amino acid ABC transporter permease [Halomonadaceae]|uniref:amino acid ABC transporter permease n=1 Tax=Halomonadaceae TaxID=28256 RepID=UPI00159B2CC1|nr:MULTISPECIES: amino acid ABC transporter permease [Halomonas]QJQ93864.1 amino acid ABC transporter permease [Halomonas sp. PA5]